MNLVKMVFGSRLFGTATKDSDTDIKSVYIPTARDILLQRVKPVIVKNTNYEGKNGPEDVDEEQIALHSFMKMLGEGQTNAIDMLFAPKESILENTHWWDYLKKNCHLVLSRKSQSFVGYCRSQAYKYSLKGDRVAAIDAVVDLLKGLPVTEKLDTVSDTLSEFVGQWKSSEIVPIKMQSGTAIDHLSVADRKVPFTKTVKEALEVYTKTQEEYGRRARASANSNGVDWKALSHAVRIAEEAKELLTTCHVTLPRPNAAYLIEIKQGLRPFEEVSEKIDSLLVEVEEISENSVLPPEPNYEFIDNFVMEVYKNARFS